jgi:hypothetical protein
MQGTGTEDNEHLLHSNQHFVFFWNQISIRLGWNTYKSQNPTLHFVTTYRVSGFANLLMREGSIRRKNVSTTACRLLSTASGDGMLRELQIC